VDARSLDKAWQSERYPGWRGAAYGAAAVGAAAAGAYGAYDYYNNYNNYNNGCYTDSYGQYICPNQYPYRY
jgi:hypothetical protein